MEDSPAPECSATNRSDDVRSSVRDDIGLDGERKHQRFRESAPGCKPVGAGGFSAQSITAFASSSLTIEKLA